MTSRYRCFHCETVVEAGEEHRHPLMATKAPQTIDEMLRDPSPGLSGRFKIDLQGPGRGHVVEQLLEHLAHVHGPGTIEWHITDWCVVEWQYHLRSDNDG